MDKLSLTLFKYRSYTPIPFIVLMLVFENANVYSLVVGLLIALLGESIRFWGVAFAGSETRSTGNVGGTYLVVSGPFAHVRNPLYSGNILLYTGLGVMSFALFPYLQIAGLFFFILQYYAIVKKEEEYLRKTFGAGFDEYTKNVKRFFPRITPFKPQNYIEQPPLRLKAGIRSEMRTFQAFAVVLILVIVKYLSRVNNWL